MRNNDKYIETNQTYIYKTDNLIMFWCAVIFVSILLIFSNLDIKLNILYGTLIALIFAMYIYRNHKRTSTEKNELIIKKMKSLLPLPKKIHDNDVQNFLFSIQDFYQYNPQVYEDFIEELDNFFMIYDQVIINQQLSGINYNLLEDKRRLLCSILESIIYNIPPNLIYEKKLQNAVSVLDFILEEYTNTVKQIFKKDISENGYINSTQLPNTGPLAYNAYDDNIFLMNFKNN